MFMLTVCATLNIVCLATRCFLLCVLGQIGVAIFDLQGRELFLSASYLPRGTAPVLLKN